MKSIIYFIIISSFLFSCHKLEDLPDVDDATRTRDLVVNQNFNWKSHVDSRLVVQLQSTENHDGEPILLYDQNFNLISKSIVENQKAIFKSELPSSIDQVFVFLPSTRASLSVSNFAGNSNINFNADVTSKTFDPGLFSSPDCSTDCDITVSNSNQSLNVPDGQTVCLTGSLNGTLTMIGTCTLKICGTAILSNINLNGNGSKSIIVTNFGVFNASSLNMNSGMEVRNFSDNFNVSGVIQVSGSLFNYGKMDVGSVNLNNGGSFENYGELDVNGGFTAGDYFRNSGSIAIDGDFSINSSEGSNYCKIISAGNITLNNSMVNEGYIKSANNLTLNGNGKIEMQSGAMISSKNLTLNGWIDGGTSGGQVLVTNSTTINGSGKITGLIDFCDLNGLESSNGSIGASVTYCQGYIPISSCNPEGYGYSTQVDSDNDGIIDSQDDFPTNPSLAIKTMSPYNGYKTIAFEDLWPSLGDFDFNDLTIKTKVEYKSNAQNKLVEANVTVVLCALGAGIHNGIGLQFLNQNNTQITNMISSVEGAVLDAADLDCVKITNDVFSELSHYYTNTDYAKSSEPDTLVFKIIFNPGFELNNMVEDFYIFRSNDRGLEIHVMNRRPTGGVSASGFNTYDDNSNAASGIFYKSKTNLPWAIEIIDGTGGFLHPMEKVDIINAYSMFAGWATTSGNSNSNWHKTPSQSKVFYKYFGD